MKHLFFSLFLLLSTNVCAQTATINCQNCNGVGSFRCRTCGGSGSVMYPGMYGPQWSKCGFCNGSGTSVCPVCGGGGKVTVRTDSPNPPSPQSNPSSQSNESNQKIKNSTGGTRKCSYCTNGRVLIERSVPSYGGINTNKGYCHECNKTYSKAYTHTHINCTHCKGKGYVNN